jgi:hypothetical protein
MENIVPIPSPGNNRIETIEKGWYGRKPQRKYYKIKGLKTQE